MLINRPLAAILAASLVMSGCAAFGEIGQHLHREHEEAPDDE